LKKRKGNSSLGKKSYFVCSIRKEGLPLSVKERDSQEVAGGSVSREGTVMLGKDILMKPRGRLFILRNKDIDVLYGIWCEGKGIV